MKYLVGFETENEAKQRSEEIAIVEGCVGEVSKYWFGIIKHKDRDEWAMCIPEGEEDKITQNEQDLLKEHSELDLDGWFPEIIN